MNKSIALVVAVALAASACSRHEHDSKGDRPAGAEAAHAHGGDQSITHYTDATELFVEFPKLVQGEEAAFAAHVTRLEDFAALSEGEVTVRLSGRGHPDEAARAAVSANPGIFRP